MPITSAIIRLGGWERSMWLRIALDPDRPDPPAMRVSYGPRAEQVLPISWEGSETTTLLGLDADRPATLLAIDSDRGALPPWLVQIWSQAWQRVTDPPALRLLGAGVIEAQGAFKHLTLTFAPSDAVVTIGWLDQRATVHLSAHAGSPVSVTLSRPAELRGAVLLPPVRIDRLAILSDPAAGSFSLRDVTIDGRPRQAWAAGSWSGGRLSGGREVVLPISRPLNAAGLPLHLALWLLISGLGVAALCGLAFVSARLERWSGTFDAVESPIGRWLRERTTGWTPARVMVAVAGCTLAYHVSYVVSVPAHYSYDGLGYYAYGRNLLTTHRLDAIATCRTPGYPGAIALTILLFGDQVRAIVLLQHLSLCALGVLAAWFLYPRVGPAWAALGGLLAGVSPIMSIVANVVWTETLFIASGTAALLVFLKTRRSGVAGMAAAGALAGVATLIRPNGAIIILLMVGWLFAAWWCRAGLTERFLPVVGRVMAIVIATTVITGGWMLHFHRLTGHWGLSDADCDLEGQTHAAAGTDLTPSNSLQGAAFVNVISQHNAVGTLQVAGPLRVFYDFFPARHRYFVPRFLPWDLIYDDRYPGEVVREYIRRFPGTYARQVRDALVFNLTHVARRSSSIFFYPDVQDVLTFQRSRTYPIVRSSDARIASLLQARTVTWADADVLLSHFTSAPAPARSVLRSLHLAINRVALSLWAVLAVLAGLGTAVCALVPGYRSCVLLALHASVLAAAPAAVAMAADRYAMVAEVPLYILSVLLISFLAGHRLRRRA
ncbi:MAG TPA: hypothetical protein VN716_20830 [Vicinamibacterales bacterium]|nr:hypothetical protein [Vicinamibacterales bacterium]